MTATMETEVQKSVPESEEELEPEAQDDKDGGGEDPAAIETRARDMGWVPRDRFKGPDEAWQPAAEWLERGDRLMGFQLRQEQKERARERSEFEKRIERIERMNTIALKRQRETITAEFEARKREAVKLGDEETYDRVDKAQTAALKELDAEPKDEESNVLRLTARDRDTVGEFEQSNPWFKTDRRLTAAMDDHFDEVGREMPGASMTDRLDEARRRTEAEYPDKFGKRKPATGNGQDARPRVEGASRVAGGGKQRLASRLPAEARAIAERNVKDGLFKSVEDYAKIYFEDEDT